MARKARFVALKLGISSFTFTWTVGFPGKRPPNQLTLQDLLDRATNLGVHLLQIGDHLPLHEVPEPELAAFDKRARELGIDIEVGTRGVGHEELRTYIGLAKRLGSPILRTVVDTATHEPALDEIVGNCKDMLSEFERAGVTFAIENHDRLKVRELVEIVKRVDSKWVGICLDTTNSFGAGEGPEYVIEGLAPFAVNFHLKDYTVYRFPHMMGLVIEGRPMGQGMLDVKWALDTVIKYGRDPNTILELWTYPEDTLEATQAKQDAWAAASVEYMRRFIKD